MIKNLCYRVDGQKFINRVFYGGRKMRYTRPMNAEKDRGITGKEMLVSALSEKTGKTEKELMKISKSELRKMWDKLESQ